MNAVLQSQRRACGAARQDEEHILFAELHARILASVDSMSAMLRFTITHIGAMVAEKQVRRVHAWRRITAMAYTGAVVARTAWNLSVGERPDEAVNQPSHALMPDQAVPALDTGASPKQAAGVGLGDTFFEQVLERRVLFTHRVTYSGVVKPRARQRCWALSCTLSQGGTGYG